MFPLILTALNGDDYRGYCIIPIKDSSNLGELKVNLGDFIRTRTRIAPKRLKATSLLLS